MQKQFRTSFVFLLLITLIVTAAQIYAQNAAQPLNIGDTLTLNLPPAVAEGENLTAPAEILTFTLNEPQYVTLIVRPLTDDGTEPLLGLYDGTRQLARVNRTTYALSSTSFTDAIIENQLLYAGTYNVTVQRVTAEGSGDVAVSLLEGEAPFLGMGEIHVIDTAIGSGERFYLNVDFREGEVISLAAVAPNSEEVDLRINVRNPEGTIIARNDDHETLEVFLGDFDPKIERLTIPADGSYEIMVRGFSGDDSGPFRFIFTRYGILDTSTAGVTTLTENSLANARNEFTLEAQSGEIITITARAIDNSSIDPEIRLLDPDNIFVAINDDHGTSADDLGTYDARIERVLLTKTGTYSLDINSVSGFGAYEVVIERFGVFQSTALEPIDLSNIRIAGPPSATDTPAPEVTAEPSN